MNDLIGLLNLLARLENAIANLEQQLRQSEERNNTLQKELKLLKSNNNS